MTHKPTPPSGPFDQFEKGTNNPLTAEDVQETRDLIAKKVGHLPLIGRYKDPVMKLETGGVMRNIFEAALAGELKPTGEVALPGLHIIERKAEFLLPDGNHIALMHGYAEYEDADPTRPEDRDEWYEAYYLTPLTTDSEGRISGTKQTFDFSVQDPTTPKDPTKLKFVVTDFEARPPGVMSSHTQRFIEGLPAVAEQRYDVLAYTRTEHDWLQEILKDVQPGDQLSPEDCWMYGPTQSL